MSGRGCREVQSTRPAAGVAISGSPPDHCGRGRRGTIAAGRSGRERGKPLTGLGHFRHPQAVFSRPGRSNARAPYPPRAAPILPRGSVDVLSWMDATACGVVPILPPRTWGGHLLRFLFALLLETACRGPSSPDERCGRDPRYPSGFGWSGGRTGTQGQGANGTIMYKLTPYQAPSARRPARSSRMSMCASSVTRGSDGELQRTQIKALGGRDVVISEIVFEAKVERVLRVCTSERPWPVPGRPFTAGSSRPSG